MPESDFESKKMSHKIPFFRKARFFVIFCHFFTFPSSHKLLTAIFGLAIGQNVTNHPKTFKLCAHVLSLTLLHFLQNYNSFFSLSAQPRDVRFKASQIGPPLKASQVGLFSHGNIFPLSVSHSARSSNSFFGF